MDFTEGQICTVGYDEVGATQSKTVVSVITGTNKCTDRGVILPL